MLSKYLTIKSMDQTFKTKADIYTPEKLSQLISLYKKNYIPMGSAYSYIAASFNSNCPSIDTSKLNRVLKYSISNQTIEVEAGCSLRKIYNITAKDHLIIPVMPGYSDITVGGCIGVNIHGKNHYKEGCFKNHVQSLKLLKSNGDIVTTYKGEELFEKTLGGFGLTGFIISAEIKLKKVPSLKLEETIIRVQDIQETVNKMIQMTDSYDYMYSWNDLTHSSKLGRGAIIASKFSKETNTKFNKIPSLKLLQKSDGLHRLPFPIFNKYISPLLNKLYYIKELNNRVFSCRYDESIFPIHQKSFYYGMHGKRGFLEMQSIIPYEVWEQYCYEFLCLYKKSKESIHLFSIKLFSGEGRYIQFDGKGVGLSFDLPNTQDALDFLKSVDLLNIKYKIKTNISKDSRLSKLVIEHTYPELSDFLSNLENKNTGAHLSKLLI